MRTFSRSEQVKLALGRFWCKYLVDEDPDSRAQRVRLERMEHMRINSDPIQAMRLWEASREQVPEKLAEAA